ncbi:hypothetical protein MTR67_007531 [Solanum verrucosum]|uniref:Uncharacterized protein n=1 Tax=Solanum verrucosum TaxID=315347 RepID=A0AAF0Q022_SOLVR|nr:hypothetical protein MTR67_007531 [Solanum verrucosum]
MRVCLGINNGSRVSARSRV